MSWCRRSASKRVMSLITSTRPCVSRSPDWIMARDRVLFLGHGFKLDHGEVAARREAAVLVEHVGDAARHAGREVAARRPDHHHDAARHVLAAVIAGALDHRDGAGIANREALAGDAAEIDLALDRAVRHGV